MVAFIDSYMLFLGKHHRKVLVFWMLWFLFSGLFGLRLLSNTKTQYNPPDGTPSAISQKIFTDAFPVRAAETALVVLVSSDVANATAIVAPGGFVDGLTALLNSSLVSTRAKYEGVWTGEFTGYFTVRGTPLDSIKGTFVSAAGGSTFMSISVRATEDTAITDFIVALRQWCADYQTQFGGDSLASASAHYTVGVTGLGALFYDVLSGSEKDMIKMDSIVLPLALTVLGFFLASFRLILVPIICVIVSLLSAFTLMLPVALYAFTVSSTTPSIMMSLALAMSFDYSLFLLSRFREEVGYGRSIPLAVKLMVKHAGHIVMLSGLTLSLCFLGLVFFPIDFLRTIGIGAAITLCVCIVVNLTLVPSLLLAFPAFFSQFALPAWMLACCGCLCNTGAAGGARNSLLAGASSLNDSADDETDVDAPLSTPRKGSSGRQSFSAGSSVSASPAPGAGALSYGSMVVGVMPASAATPGASLLSSTSHLRQLHDPQQQQRSNQWRADEAARQQQSFWYRTAKVTTGRSCAWLIVVAVLAAAVPVAYQISSLETTVNVDLIYPRDSPALLVYDQLKTDFSAGLLAQYFVIVQSPSKALGAIWTADAFTAIASLASTLVAAGDVQAKDVTSVAYFGGLPITLDSAKDQFSPSKDADPFAIIYRQFFRANTDAANATTLLTISLDFDPLGDQAAPWVKKVRATIDAFNAAGGADGLQWFLAGGGCATVDTVDKIYSLFPLNVGLTAAVVFVIVAYVFKSVFIPLRLLLTIALPICWVFGLAVLVYQHDNFTWISSILNAPKVYWLVPIMSLSILVGLGLDYDLFLFLRVQEYREAGFTTEAAMRKGLYRTGSVITTAGLIMVIAFGGMQFSHSMVLNQFSLMLFACVLVDTFLVRTTLVPALVSLAGEFNWWPRQMPPGTKGDDVFEDELEVDNDETILDDDENHQSGGGANGPATYQRV